MAVVNFPDNPSDGDTQDVGGITYTYSSSKGYWTAAASGGGGGGGASVTTDDTAPSSPNDGDLWWDSDGGKMYVYYADADSSQWVSVSVPGPVGATGAAGPAGASASNSYANLATFPATPTEGDIAYAQDTDALYVYKGTAWSRIDSGDESPIIITEPVTSVPLDRTGTTSNVTMVASDPEGFPITYGIAYNNSTNSLPDQLASATTINQSTGVYTFTPSTDSADEGTFKARLSASDGAKTTTRLVDFDLTFWATVSGGDFTTVDGYNYHTFTQDGTLTVSDTGTIEYIVVAGGGGGGGFAGGGGGGGGGVRYGTTSVSAGSVTVTVGAGGTAGANAQGANGGNGGNSSLGSISATGGGGGAGHTNGTAQTGGSGGGGAPGGGGTFGAAGNAGNYTPAEGNQGGNHTGQYTGGGGGGGAGQAGQSQVDMVGGKGGDGYQWVDGRYYGGGGGGGHHTASGQGGLGGLGGGAAGGSGGDTTVPAAINNTGGGGGGAGGLSGSYSSAGGAGGSGIVIVRVAV